jgi:serine/threonine protein phosphatase 1
MAIYAIGDIHGEIDLLLQALSALRNRLRSKDRVVFLGDYVDRGPDSKGCIDQLIAFREEHPNAIFLRGNHDQFLLSAFDEPVLRVDGEYCEVGGETMLWLQNGGDIALRSYGIDTIYDWQQKIDPTHIEFLKSTRIEWKSRHYRFVHAGVVPTGVEWTETGREPRLWIRDAFLESTEDFGHVIVFGHTVQRRNKPLVMVNKIGIDTGAVFGGALSMARLDGLRRNEKGLPCAEIVQFFKKGVAAKEWELVR